MDKGRRCLVSLWPSGRGTSIFSIRVVGESRGLTIIGRIDSQLWSRRGCQCDGDSHFGALGNKPICHYRQSTSWVSVSLSSASVRKETTLTSRDRWGIEATRSNFYMTPLIVAMSVILALMIVAGIILSVSLLGFRNDLLT